MGLLHLLFGERKEEAFDGVRHPMDPYMGDVFGDKVLRVLESTGSTDELDAAKSKLSGDIARGHKVFSDSDEGQVASNRLVRSVIGKPNLGEVSKSRERFRRTLERDMNVLTVDYPVEAQDSAKAYALTREDPISVRDYAEQLLDLLDEVDVDLQNKRTLDVFRRTIDQPEKENEALQAKRGNGRFLSNAVSNVGLLFSGLSSAARNGIYHALDYPLRSLEEDVRTGKKVGADVHLKERDAAKLRRYVDAVGEFLGVGNAYEGLDQAPEEQLAELRRRLAVFEEEYDGVDLPNTSEIRELKRHIEMMKEKLSGSVDMEAREIGEEVLGLEGSSVLGLEGALERLYDRQSENILNGGGNVLIDSPEGRAVVGRVMDLVGKHVEDRGKKVESDAEKSQAEGAAVGAALKDTEVDESTYVDEYYLPTIRRWRKDLAERHEQMVSADEGLRGSVLESMALAGDYVSMVEAVRGGLAEDERDRLPNFVDDVRCLVDRMNTPGSKRNFLGMVMGSLDKRSASDTVDLVSDMDDAVFYGANFQQAMNYGLTIARAVNDPDDEEHLQVGNRDLFRQGVELGVHLFEERRKPLLEKVRGLVDQYGLGIMTNPELRKQLGERERKEVDTAFRNLRAYDAGRDFDQFCMNAMYYADKVRELGLDHQEAVGLVSNHVKYGLGLDLEDTLAFACELRGREDVFEREPSTVVSTGSGATMEREGKELQKAGWVSAFRYVGDEDRNGIANIEGVGDRAFVADIFAGCRFGEGMSTKRSYLAVDGALHACSNGLDEADDIRGFAGVYLGCADRRGVEDTNQYFVPAWFKTNEVLKAHGQVLEPSTVGIAIDPIIDILRSSEVYEQDWEGICERSAGAALGGLSRNPEECAEFGKKVTDSNHSGWNSKRWVDGVVHYRKNGLNLTSAMRISDELERYDRVNDSYRRDDIDRYLDLQAGTREDVVVENVLGMLYGSNGATEQRPVDTIVGDMQRTLSDVRAGKVSVDEVIRPSKREESA